MPIDAALYKDVMARWSSGVTVVTTIYEGRFKGTTASSFTSVSLDPPLVLICLAQKLYTHQLVHEAGIFAVNILGSHQAEWGKLFAGMYPEIEDRFAGIDVSTAATGCPLLPDTLGWLDCRVAHRYPGGDHTIFVGEVLAGGVPPGRMDSPLLYHNRAWGHFAGLDEAE
jgi:flavin reductase (DIM6/NTAB) family NADH-FMN oxidoreductase RutF